MTTIMSQNVPPVHLLQIRCDEESPDETSSTQEDFHKLKEISEKLKLSTRRPSVVQWKQIIENRKLGGQYLACSEAKYLDEMTATRTQTIEVADADERDSQVCAAHNQLLPKNHAYSLIQSNPNTPTRMSTLSPIKTVVPTPVRRWRRITRTTIPEIFVEDCSRTTDDDTSYHDVIINGISTTTSGSSRLGIPPDAEKSMQSDDEISDDDINTRYRKVTQAFDTIRRELVIMRIEDNKLARKLLDVRSEMNLLRAQRSCEEHADMLDVVTYELEEEEELTGLIKACDLSDRKPTFLLSAFSPLRDIGVSRMNLNRRRFSIR